MDCSRGIDKIGILRQKVPAVSGVIHTYVRWWPWALSPESATVYSSYSQLPSILGRLSLWGRATPCCQDHLEYLLVDRRIILKWTFKKEDGGSGWDWYYSGQKEVAASCKQSNENSGSIKYREFRDNLRNYQLLKGGSASWSYLFIYLFIYLFSCILHCISWYVVHGQRQILYVTHWILFVYTSIGTRLSDSVESKFHLMRRYFLIQTCLPFRGRTEKGNYFTWIWSNSLFLLNWQKCLKQYSATFFELL
jgi:hypothetical protein